MKKLKPAAAAAVLLLLLLHPLQAVSGAQRAMRLWYESVAPALFPFLALLPLLTGGEACRAYEAVLGGIMRRLLRLPGTAAPAVAIGLIAGSPGGAMALRRVAGQTGMKQRDARRIALGVCGLSPAYLILGVGQGLWGSARFGLRLALIQLAAQLLLLRLLNPGGEDAPLPPLPPARDRRPLAGAVESVLLIGGCMVLFASVGSVLASIAGDRVGTALLLVLDLPSGLPALRAAPLPGRMLIQGAAIGFGGLCIAAQNMDALREIGVGWKDYLASRCVAAVIIGCANGLIPLRAGADASAAASGVNFYALSLLAAALLALPALIFLSKNSFLNKSR